MRVATKGLLRGLCFFMVMGLVGNLFAGGLDTLRDVADYGSTHIPYTVLTKRNPLDSVSSIPVFIFLHGAGERGTDNRAQTKVGLPALIQSLDSLDSLIPSYVIYAPQCPLDKKWVDTDWTLPGHKMAANLNPPLAAAMVGFVQLLRKNPRLDRRRIYLTGLSMGGFGVWELLQRYPQYFAAAIPICGGGDPAQIDALTRTPIHAFHGRKDKLVKVARTTEMIDALIAKGHHPQMNILEDQGHLCWNAVYKNVEVIHWFISQRRHDR